jgi:PQQ-like domain
MEWPFIEDHLNLFVDFHLVYAIVIVYLIAHHAGRVWGLDGAVERLPLVAHNQFLKSLFAANAPEEYLAIPDTVVGKPGDRFNACNFRSGEAMHQIIMTVVSLVLLASTADFGFAAELSVPAQPEWASARQNNHNTRYAATEHTINSDNVGSLKPKWTFTTAGDVSATATVVNGVAYVPDWGGKLWAIDTETGKAIWSHDISDYAGTTGSASRTSPAYWDGELVIGTGNLMTADLSGAFEVGVDARTGAMLWRRKTDPSSAALMTTRPSITESSTPGSPPRPSTST